MTASSHTKTYIAVFAALMALTIVTVGISLFHLGIAAAVGLALVVAITKGSLVAAYFMHLIGEHKVIFLILGITAIFFLFLMVIPILSIHTDYRIR